MKSDILKRFDLTGKIAAITGGGGELCGAMAEALGAMGVKVAVLDISLEKAEARSPAIIQSGGTAKAFRCDVLDAAPTPGVLRGGLQVMGLTRFSDQRRWRQRSPGQHV